MRAKSHSSFRLDLLESEGEREVQSGSGADPTVSLLYSSIREENRVKQRERSERARPKGEDNQFTLQSRSVK